MALKDYDGRRLVRLFDSRWAALGDWRNRWEEQSFYIMPQQRSFTSSRDLGNERNERFVFDSTALEANERLATRLHEALTNPATNWFTLQFVDDELNKNDAAMEWLESAEQRMADAIRASNFNMMMAQFYLDLGCLGSALIAVDEKTPWYSNDEGFHGLNFSTLHMGEIGVAESADGIIDEVFYRCDMTAAMCVEKFETPPAKAVEHVENGKPDERIKILVCRFRRAMDSDPGVSGLLPEERPWAEVWVDYVGKQILMDGGTYERSVYVGRWRKKSHDIMGYGPGERALPTIRTVNEAERLELAAWAKMIDPPMKTTQNNVIGDAELTAKGLTTLRDFDEFAQLDIRPDLNHHMIQLEDKRFQIRDIFKYHSLELPPREQVGEMTAYEVSKRVEQIYRAMGPTVVQLQADVLNDLVQRVFGILYRKNQFAELPEGLEGVDLKVEYVGPMALSANATQIEAVDRFIADGLALAQAGLEGAMDIVDLDRAQRYKAELMGVPALAIRSKTEVKKARDRRMAAQDQAAAQQSAINESEALKNMGDAVGQEALQSMMGAQ